MTNAGDGAVEGEGPKGLLVDYGGVLTTSVGRSFRAFERSLGLPKGTVLTAIVRAYADGSDEGPIGRLERGEIEIDEFDRLLAEELRSEGHEVEPGGLGARLFDELEPVERMWDVVAAAHAAGVRTALVSNSWGLSGYPRERLAEVFDAVLVSGEVGLRKPDPAIFRLACDEIGVPPDRCAFVDDFEHNVEAARQLGMFGIVHTDAEETSTALEDFLGVSLSS